MTHIRWWCIACALCGCSPPETGGAGTAGSAHEPIQPPGTTGTPTGTTPEFGPPAEQAGDVAIAELTGATGGTWFGGSAEVAGDTNGNGQWELVATSVVWGGGPSTVWWSEAPSGTHPVEDVATAIEIGEGWLGSAGATPTADVTGDGLPDVWAGPAADLRALVPLGGRAGTSPALGTPLMIPADASSVFTQFSAIGAHAAGDANGDGVVDLVAGVGPVELLLGPDYHAGFSLAWEEPAELPRITIQYPGDVDGDGVSEVLIVNQDGYMDVDKSQPHALLVPSDATGNYILYQHDLPPGSAFFGSHITAALVVPDWTGDGVPDVLVSTSGALDVIEGPPPPVWTDGDPVWAELTLDDISRQVEAIADVGDVDGDGLDDIAVLGTLREVDSLEIALVRGGTAGSSLLDGAPRRIGFDRRTSFSVIDASSDLDGDGVRDLVVGCPTDLAEPTYPGAVWILPGGF